MYAGLGAAQTAVLTLTLPSLGPGARIRLARGHLKRHQRRPVPTSIPRLFPPQRRTERGGVLPHHRYPSPCAASPPPRPARRTRPPLRGARPFPILSPITSLGIATMGDMGANMGMGSVIANMVAWRAVP
ncbi:hypothetical protein FIBSPDRAFT_866382 [Athelia psychrophila]|uniref:Uncharacterized protein n=1 Tax=Athelia psychrophila TaxID=1759441 RepID=A0A166EP27_9AGAM|nr:hypothetical protein FIBSPDRAFT_866382 [Fibularhizoctonia sp. CBS 109695]